MAAPVVLRAVVLAGASHCCYLSCTAPTPPASADEQNKYTAAHDNPDPFGSFPRTVPELFKVSILADHIPFKVGSLILSEANLPLSLSPQRQHLLVIPATASSISTSPRNAGLLFVLVGAYLRVTCYRLLSRSFTFELSLQKDHKLVTHGLYAWVRHPSYTSAILVLAGAALIVLGPGSWWAERGVDHWLTYASGILFAVYLVGYALGIAKRCVVEDALLKAHFRDEWVRWAQRTPYRLFPFLW